ncbi:MAG: HAD family phosphatase [Phycisphaeraceae bacterium]
MLQAIVFDFDGLMLDTETPQYLAWRELFRRHGHELPIERWVDVLGRPEWSFDFHAHLEELAGLRLDRERLTAERRSATRDLIDEADLLPGVRDLVERAVARGLKLAVASGSDRPWVAGYLERHGLLGSFPVLVTREETTTHKPGPEPFAEACRRLGVAPGHALALEDSPNGIASAHAAGLYAVAVPNEVTRDQTFPGAAMVLATLEGLDLDAIDRTMSARGME